MKGVISDVVPQKLLQDLDVQGASFSACPPELLEQVQPLLVGEGSKVEGPLVEEFLPCVRGDDRSDDAAGAASRNDPRQAVGFNQRLHYSDVIHSHDGASAEQKRTPSNRMPHLSEELQFLSLRDVRPHDRLQSLRQLLLVLLNEPFRARVGMPIEERAIGVGDIPVAVRPYDLYQLKRIAFLSCLIHQSDQLLEILIIVIGRVDLIDPGLHIRYLIILLRQRPPGCVSISLLHESFDLLHLARGLDGLPDLLFVVICNLLDDGELVVYLLADGLPEVAERLEQHCDRVKIILIIKVWE